ncbi:MAG: tRNA (guanosine(37)-N1)-methyltransferase TrmD [Patescibacteria group bacterium]
MKFSIITLFPDMFTSPFAYSIIKRAVEKNQIHIDIVNLRDFSTDAYKSVDDRPYGGGAGMILRVDIIDKALKSIKKGHTILLDPGGTPYKQSMAKQLATTYDHIILLCGHYEGIDERVRSLVDQEISIGDYVLTGGEIPTLVVVDSVTRLLTGVLSKPEATVHESFTEALLEYPQYTRPASYKDQTVPEILLSGDHKKIAAWQKAQAIKKTKHTRPDLL